MNHHFVSINHFNSVGSKFYNFGSSFSHKRKLFIYTVFSLGERNALIIFIVECNPLILLISPGTFALRFDLVSGKISVLPVLCIINKTSFFWRGQSQLFRSELLHVSLHCNIFSIIHWLKINEHLPISRKED